MDIESDESERWEDFYGSSTDLVSSVIGYYDQLTVNNNNNNNNNNSIQVAQNDLKIVSSAKETTATSCTTTNKKQVRNIRILSPTVQRIISHSGQTIDTSPVNNNHPNICQTVNGGGINLQKRVGHPKPNLNSTKSNSHSHIPLSKNICKFTQSGNELIETIEQNSKCNEIENENEQHLTNDEDDDDDGSKEDQLKTPTNLIDENICAREVIVTTPTNLHPNPSFLYDTLRRSQENIKLNESFENLNHDFSDNNLSIDDNKNPTIPKLQYTSSTSSADSTFIRPKMSCAQNKIYHDTDSEDGFTESVGEASNFYIRLPDDVRESMKLECNRSTVIFREIPITKNGTNNNNNSTSTLSLPTTPTNNNTDEKISYSKKKILLAKTNSNSNSSSSKENLKTEGKKDEKIISGNVVSQPVVVGQNGGPKNKLSVPDEKKMKNRPLSATSITSTSSSSSSGSNDHLNGKLNISYLASVESLADHSESELVNSSNLTVSERAALEIIDSEKSYVADLGQVIHGYLMDWRERACLKTDELCILFSNIEEVYEFNSKLLVLLQNSSAEPAQIAQCFIELKDEFNVYTTYCTRYPEAIALLTSLLQASHTNSLLASTQKMLKHTLPLGSYLLKPVQRILKYHLLLDNLRKHCDSPEAAKAHELMREVAKHIDQVKRSLEQQSRVKELSGILDGWLGPELTVLGDLRQEGVLMENNKARIVFLFKTMLIITKPKEDSRLQFKTYIHCKNLMLVEHLPGDPTSFHVIPFNEPRNQIKLTARNRDQKRLWSQMIKEVILEHFDIPSRAKELVFKLGDEEDRTPDKNTWKWGSNSSTPEYLERRNQYRRSEMRYRSKKARKTVQNSKSLDDSSIQMGSGDKSLDNGTIDRSRSTSIGEHLNMDRKFTKCDHSGKCTCHVVKDELNQSLRRPKKDNNSEVNSAVTRNDGGDNGFMSMRNRSKSEPRVSLISKSQSLNRGTSRLNVCEDHGKLKKEDHFEVKVYDKKTVPKRISNLKKNRTKSMKETSTFYMELKITESTDNLAIDVDAPSNVIPTATPPPRPPKRESDPQKKAERAKAKDGELQTKDDLDGGANKKDSDIIQELLKANKEFDKILKKPPSRKKSNVIEPKLVSLPHEEGHGKHNKSDIELLPPPPPLPIQVAEAEVEHVVEQNKNALLSRLNEIQNEIVSPEPIYESLKRNVHVPYKYCPSPNLQRSKSQTQPYNARMPKPTKNAERPDSDYVTLDYNVVVDLQPLLADKAHLTSELSQLRNSDSNINYNKVSSDSTEAPVRTFERHDSFSSKSSRNLLQRFVNDKILAKKNSIDGLVIKMPERRISDVSEMCRSNIIYKQGSEDLGSRIANLDDYADPKTLFANNKSTTTPTQRDSVLTLTSSSDSMCEPVTSQIQKQTIDLNDSIEMFEAALEGDDFFRDSAIYSGDDNERRFENDVTCSPHPVRPPRTPKTPQSPQTPPIVPRKPNKLQLPPPLVSAKPKINTQSSETEIKTSPRLDSDEKQRVEKCNGRSWVLQQIKNFEK